MMDFRSLLCVLIATLCVLGMSFELDDFPRLQPRTQAPAFKAKAVLNDKFINIALDDYISKKQWTILLFYPFDYTFVCPVCHV